MAETTQAFYDQVFYDLVFYEKPGCINNRKQKQILQDAGFTLDVRSLLTTRWQPGELRRFFGNTPLAAWFNPSAPAIKDGSVVPDALSEEEAIAAMLHDPLLIRRPLIASGNHYWAGFDLDALVKDLNIKPQAEIDVPEDIERCPRSHTRKSCQPMEQQELAG